MENQEDTVLRLRFAWLAKALWAVGGAAVTFLALVLPRVYDVGATTTQRNDKLEEVQQQVIELQGQLYRVETEVEWLVRHSPDAKEAPLVSPESGHSWLSHPNMTRNSAPQSSEAPANFESIAGGLR